jgi:transcriptional regulator with XRE-family HTH domain
MIPNPLVAALTPCQPTPKLVHSGNANHPPAPGENPLATHPNTPSSLGGRIRLLRNQRYLSLQQLADLAGLSASYISLIERGQRPVDRRSTIETIAQALGVDPSELIGQPLSWRDPTIADAQAGIPAVRLAVISGSLDHAPPGDRPLAELAAATDRLVAARSQADFVAMADTLPGVITGLYAAAAHSSGDQRDEALRHLIRALGTAMTLAHALGYSDLAYLTTERANHAADTLASPSWQAVAAFSTVHALLPMGARAEAWQTAVAAADTARRAATDTVSGQPGVAAYGSLLLVSAMVAAGSGLAGEADDRLTEAADIAGRTGECGPDLAMFGPTNVNLYQLAAALERGQHDRAVDHAARVDPAVVPNSERRAHFLVNQGRALTGAGRSDQAVRALVAAEHEAPARVRTNVYARESVTALLPRVRPTGAEGRALRGLVYRMGIQAAS